ncbi:high mobility group protein B1-like protein [Cricetulus griseus]|uniref:High mobility group protein B1-like protein n=1 Tax=Cricetulus griseus TaxID=10029 RepID=A0A061IAS0_CRIGR|nr:high mobility group protein B1-like protein [Cricetulus griseus]
MCSYAFFEQTCREGHKKHPDASVNFSEISNKCSERRTTGLSIGDVANKLGEMGNSTAADDKQPYEKAARLKEKHEKDVTACRAQGKLDAAKKGVLKAEKSKTKKKGKVMRRMKGMRKKKATMMKYIYSL